MSNSCVQNKTLIFVDNTDINETKEKKETYLKYPTENKQLFGKDVEKINLKEKILFKQLKHSILSL